jgi:acetylornithine deacetylase/succinyl-diaminopimelate desuccinylase family protein
MSPAEKLLRELIALPSVNPAFIPPNDPRAGEKRVADFLIAFAGAAKLDVEQRQVFAQRSNVLLRLSPKSKARHRIILAPHMDTVPATVFTPVKKNERLYGRGACDTKGSIAAMVSALIAIANSPRRPDQTEIVVTALVDEECGQGGSRALTKEGFRGDLAIVGEPTQLKVITAHKGDVWLTVRTHGKAAHSSMPTRGVNAIHYMARLVNALQTDYAAQLAARKHPLLGAPTVNVGTIRGGTQPNIVPDECEISIDRRTLPGETNASVMRELKSLLRANKITAAVSDNKDAAPCWPMDTNPELPFVKRFMQALNQRVPRGVHYFSDAAIFAASGTPAVLFGPGDIAQAHTVDEWISIRSLDRATALLTKFLQSLP